MQKPLSQTEIKALAAIIEGCCQRGAFRGKELVPVGNLFNRLTSVPENEQPTPFNQGGNINDDQGDGNKDK